MAQKTKINWTEYSWNPLTGCSKASAGCANCYAIRDAHRMAGNPRMPQYQGVTKKNADGSLDWTGVMKEVPHELETPLKWRDPRLVFIPSLSDMFHRNAPDGIVERVFAVMALAKNMRFSVLTKRSRRMADAIAEMEAYTPDRIREILKERVDPVRLEKKLKDYQPQWPLSNVILGVSVEDQVVAERRLVPLKELHDAGWKTFVSAEPLIGELDVVPWIDGIDQLIVGGESKANARPMHPDWARSLRDQAQRHGTPFHFKQWGEWAPADQVPEEVRASKKKHQTHKFEDGVEVIRYGVKKCGMSLDGRTWTEDLGTEKEPVDPVDHSGPGESVETEEPPPVPAAEASAADTIAVPADPSEITQEAERLLRHEPDLVQRIVDDFHKIGVVADTQLAFTLYMIGTSRMLDHPLAGLVQGPTASGKTYVVNKIAELFPPEEVIRADELSSQALYYFEEGALEHRLVVAGERSHIRSPEQKDARKALREMLSSGVLHKSVTEKTPEGYRTREITQRGPIAFVETTTATDIFDEDANRMLLVTPDMSPEQTERIVREITAGQPVEDKQVQRVLDLHRQVQSMLRRVRVTLPPRVQQAIRSAVPGDRIESRRLVRKIVSAIEAVALLSQFRRVDDLLTAHPI